MATKSEMMMAVAAVKAGAITPDKIQECLDIQAQLEGAGKIVPFARILVKKGYLTADQVKGFAGGPAPVSRSPHWDIQQVRDALTDFEVESSIGRGGMAEVFRATHLKSGRTVAIKVLYSHHAQTQAFVDQFLREAKFLKEFDCPYIVKGYAYGRKNGLYYIAMELMEGSSVQEVIDRDGKMDETEAYFVIIQIAKALQYMADAGIVHRDIKPDNIYFSDDGSIKLLDLGFAMEIGSDEGESETTCGTVQYIAPEQARGQKVDIRADIYSLGATLYHLIMGKVPFSGKDSMEVMAKQVLEELAHMEGVSVQAQYFVEKLMAKDAEIRYQSPQEIIDDFEEVLKGMDSLVYRPDGSGGMSDTVFGGDRIARKGKPASSGEHPKVSSNARLRKGSDPGAEKTGSSSRRPSRFKRR